MAWAGLAAWLGGGHRHEDEECGLFRLMAEVREVGARYFEHRDAATGGWTRWHGSASCFLFRHSRWGSGRVDWAGGRQRCIGGQGIG